MATYFKDKDKKREFIVNRKFCQIMEGTVENFDYESKSKNGSCNDKSTITLKSDKKKIEKIMHNTSACVITTSCIDIICEKISGKSIDESLDFLYNFEKFIDRHNFNEEMLEELIVFEDIVQRATRDYCLRLPLDLILEVIKKINL